MVEFAKFSSEEQVTVFSIIDRAVEMDIYTDEEYADAEMDLSAVCFHTALRLTDLLTADDFNFGHDLAGIKRHINRQTGELENCFLPRYAR